MKAGFLHRITTGSCRSLFLLMCARRWNSIARRDDANGHMKIGSTSVPQCAGRPAAASHIEAWPCIDRAMHMPVLLCPCNNLTRQRWMLPFMLMRICICWGHSHTWACSSPMRACSCSCIASSQWASGMHSRQRKPTSCSVSSGV
eukprot:366119-Chlamydomonas_euryale.AAC.32